MRTIWGAVLATVALLLVGLATPTHLGERVPPAELPKGALRVSLTGVPDGAKPMITISGPDGFLQGVANSTSLPDLVSGQYRVSALTSATEAGIAVPKPGMTVLAVPPGGEATATVAYALRPLVEPTPTPEPLPSLPGQPGDFAFLAGTPTAPVRWNPCAPITWAFTEEAAGEQERVTAAFAQAAEATGITFTQLPTGSAAAVPVRIGFSSGSGVSGEGEMKYRFVDSWPIKGRPVIYTGTLDATIGQASPVDMRTALYLHEIGHVLGLDHVDSPDEVMYPSLSPSHVLTRYSVGDLEGLLRLGRQAGCQNPPPQVTEARATGLIRLDRPVIPQSGGDNNFVLRANRSLTFRWNATEADPPVLQTTIYRVDPSHPEVGSLVPIPLPADFRGDTVGPLEVTTLLAGEGACRAGDEYRIVRQNVYGRTVTPVFLTGCENFPPGRQD